MIDRTTYDRIRFISKMDYDALKEKWQQEFEGPVEGEEAWPLSMKVEAEDGVPLQPFQDFLPPLA